MPDRQRYRKVESSLLTAVQLKLETAGFDYHKWGDQQHCKAGDWLVDNQGECYTIDQTSFADTYCEVSPGRYRKTQLVWAEVAAEAGAISTREGRSHYNIGDYLVSNKADGSDSYAVSKTTFEAEYQLLPA